MNNYKVIAFDLDGTLLNSDRNINPASKTVLQQLQSNGIHVLLVTGRHHTAAHLYHHQLQLLTPAICCNGTYTYDYHKKCPIASTPMDRKQAHQLLSIVREFGVHTLIYADEVMVYEDADDHIKRFELISQTLTESLRPRTLQVDDFSNFIDQGRIIWKFSITSPSEERLRTFQKAVLDRMGLDGEWSLVNRIDMAAKGNTKGNRLKQWVESQGLSMNEVVAFGDNENDISMIKMAGLGIAMGNSEPALQQVASKIIGSNNSDTIAMTLKELFSLV